MNPCSLVAVVGLLAAVGSDRAACPCDYSFIGNACCYYAWRCVAARVDQWQGSTELLITPLGLPFEAENCHPCQTPVLSASQTTTFTLTDTGSTSSNVGIAVEVAPLNGILNSFLKSVLPPSFKTTFQFDRGWTNETSVSISISYTCGGNVAGCQKVAFITELREYVANYTGTVHGQTQVRVTGHQWSRPGCQGQGDQCAPSNDWENVLTAAHCPVGTATVSGRDAYAVTCKTEPRGICNPCNRCPAETGPNFEHGGSQPPPDPGTPDPG